MSIATAIASAQGKVASAYTACNAKGATMPQEQDLAHLPACIGSIPTGSAPNLTSLSVTPSTAAQQIAPVPPVDGYNEVNVGAVTAAIDQNITPRNIKKDVTILGVTGTLDSGGGSSDPVESDVNFRDFDGAIIESYTAAEFANVTAFPANPTHAGLTARGWNWTIENAKPFVAKYGGLEIGQMYITDDGKTRLYIEVEADGNNVVVRYSQTAANGVTIDWGDGSATSTQSGTGNKNPSHSYATAGSYVITLTCNSGTYQLGNNATNNILENGYLNRGFLRKVEVGSGVTDINVGCFYYCTRLSSVTMPPLNGKINTSAFEGCVGLTYLTLPRGVTETVTSAFGASSLVTMSIADDLPNVWSKGFQNCFVLDHVWFPETLTGIGNSGSTFNNCYMLRRINFPPLIVQYGNSAFSGCHVLEHITLPDTLTTIKQQMFQDCWSLQDITIPASVTTINAQAFANCYSLTKVTCLRTTPPTLSNTNAFMNYIRFIYVPADSVEAYKAASNWSTYASKILAIPES